MPSPPTFRKQNPADAPVLFMALHAPTLSLAQVDEYAETQLAQRLSTIEGVSQVDVFGAQKYAVRISVDPERLAANGIGIDQLKSAIADANVNLPTGSLFGSRQLLSIRSEGSWQKALEYGPLIVAYRNGAPVRLQDVASARDAVQNDQAASWFNGERAIVLAIRRQPGSNTVETWTGSRPCCRASSRRCRRRSSST
jgi:HAE1 family hydrophobic/amphiphilic exporter-1